MAMSRWIFMYTSRALRRTRLRRCKWLTNQHNRIFKLMWDSTVVYVGDYILHVDPRDRNIAKKLALYGEYEDHIQELLTSLAIPGSVVVDIGANIGIHTIPLSRYVGIKGQIVAFEPDPDNYRILLRNINVNGLTNVNAHQLALSSKSGSALLYQSSDNRGGLSLQHENTDEYGPQMDPVAVKTAVGDNFFADLDKPISLVKIDVEGAEPLVLLGMEKTLQKNPTIAVIFEFWPRYVRNFNIDPLEFLTKLEKDGFHLATIDSKARCIKATIPEEIVSQGEMSDTPLNVLASRRCKCDLPRYGERGETVGRRSILWPST